MLLNTNEVWHFGRCFLPLWLLGPARIFPPRLDSSIFWTKLFGLFLIVFQMVAIFSPGYHAWVRLILYECTPKIYQFLSGRLKTHTTFWFLVINFFVRRIFWHVGLSFWSGGRYTIPIFICSLFSPFASTHFLGLRSTLTYSKTPTPS